MARYPNGMSSFEKIRLGGFIYIDKTRYIDKLLESNGTYFFLGRPRRFGKSLFVSTLEAFFQGKRELFSGLEIEKLDWKWEEYPVIRIDLTPKSYSVKGDLEARLSESLFMYEKKYNLTPEKEADAQIRFYRLINRAQEVSGKPVVVLVDEYEKPIVDNLDNDELKEHNTTFLAGFYSVLKALDAKLKLVFLTGVTKFGQMSVFSGLNNIRDISLSKDYDAVCGVTEEELLHYFQEGIEIIARDEDTDFEGALKLLKENYDGYHFSEDCPDIYNPFSIINAMDNGRIGPYWATSGAPTLLAKTLMDKKFNLQRLDGVKASAARLLGVNNQFDDPIALLYQTGYLTIKNYIKKIKTYILGFPNKEVEGAFFDYLLPVYSATGNSVDTATVITDIGTAFFEGDPQKAISILKNFTASFPYDMLDRIKIEQHFQDILFIILKALLPYVSEVNAEERTSDGRSDITIKTPDFIYIIELKVDSSAKEAFEQIQTKEYALPYINDPRTVFLIGINFSTEKRRIDDFLTIQL